jgi:hypothetical protein
MTERTSLSARLARVARVIGSGHELVINQGTGLGVGVGDRYLVYTVGPMLKDPETGEDLGELEVVRGRGRVVHVQERVATIRCTDTKPSGTRRYGRGILNPFIPRPGESDSSQPQSP